MGMICRIREVLEGDLDRLTGPREQAHDLFRCDHLSGPVLSLEKAWHGLHYLLTGSPWKGAEPLCFLVRGGRAVGPDLGYGRPRLLGVDFVQRLDTALQEVGEERLWEGFDAGRFKAEKIYPGIWDEPEDQLREEYLWYFRALQAFVRKAARQGAELLVVTV